FELHTNQWNILVVNPEDSGIVNVLRGRRAGTRALFPGRRYELPDLGGPRYGAQGVPRAEAWTRWQAEVAHKPAAARRTSVLRSFAFTGTLNTRWILSAETEQAAFERWWWLRSLPTPEPGLVTNGERRTPYPLPLEGWEWEGASSLLAAMDRLADLDGEELSTVAAGNEEVEAAVEARIQALGRRLERLRRELADAADDAERSRAAGDLLLANLHRVTRGAESVLLQDWEGEEIEIPLDPTLSPAENAAHLYESARRKRRAEERLPEVIGETEAELERWRDVLVKVRAGQTSET